MLLILQGNIYFLDSFITATLHGTSLSASYLCVIYHLAFILLFCAGPRIFAGVLGRISITMHNDTTIAKIHPQK